MEGVKETEEFKRQRWIDEIGFGFCSLRPAVFRPSVPFDFYRRDSDLVRLKSTELFVWREIKISTATSKKNYAGKILECHLNLWKAVCVGAYLPDKVTSLILQYLSNSISKAAAYNLLQPRLDVVLFR